MPQDMLSWIENMVTTIKYILDKQLFNYTKGNINLEEEHFNEFIYGLKLTICHIKTYIFTIWKKNILKNYSKY